MSPWGLGLCKGGPGRLSLPDPSPLVSVPFSCQSLMQTEGRRGEERRVSGWERAGLQGGSQPGLGPGLGPGLHGRQAGRRPPCPPPPCSGPLSHGVPEQSRRGWGGLIGSPAPGGSRAPRPARGAARLCSARLSSPPLPSPSPRAGNVLFPPLPPRGQRAGRAGVLPSAPHLLPAQVRAGAGAGAIRSRATVAAPDSQPPTPRLAGARAWQGQQGWGARREARTGTPWWPCPWRAGPGPGHEGGHFLASPGPHLGEPASLLLWIQSRVAPSSLHLPPSFHPLSTPLPRSVHSLLLSPTKSSFRFLTTQICWEWVGASPSPSSLGAGSPHPPDPPSQPCGLGSLALHYSTLPWPSGPSPPPPQRRLRGPVLSLPAPPCPFAQLPRHPQ